MPAAMCLLGERNRYPPRWFGWLPKLESNIHDLSYDLPPTLLAPRTSEQPAPATGRSRSRDLLRVHYARGRCCSGCTRRDGDGDRRAREQPSWREPSSHQPGECRDTCTEQRRCGEKSPMLQRVLRQPRRALASLSGWTGRTSPRPCDRLPCRNRNRRRPALRAWALIASVSRGSMGAPPSTRLRHSQRPTVGGRSVSQATRNRGPAAVIKSAGLAVWVRGRSRRGPRWARRSGRSSRCGSPGGSRPEEFPAS
jgi:hypothetical protein